MKKISLMLFLFNMSIISLFCNSLFENLSNTTFIIEEHFSVLEKRDRNYLIQLYPDIAEKCTAYDGATDTDLYWYDINPIGELSFVTIFTENRKGIDYEYISCLPYALDIEVLKRTTNIILFDVKKITDLGKHFNSYFIPKTVQFNETDYNMHTAKIIIDGDYLDFYIDDVFIHTFCKINEATLKEYENLIKNNTCDLSKVTWPRHADGTSDYDDKIIMPEPLIPTGNTDIDEVTAGKDKVHANIGESEKIKKVQVKSKNQIMAVKIPAVLRADPSIEKGTSMLKAVTGSRVQIIKVGKKQIIDNIESNWVKVKFLDGAKKVTGKDVSPDTVGWLFGGYLE